MQEGWPKIRLGKGRMIYIGEDGKMQCTKCCIGCEVEERLCGARKERRKKVNKMIQKAEKEYLGEQEEEL